MARKRSPKGRLRKATPASRLNITISKVNKRLNRLEKAGMYGQYSFKKLLRRFEDQTDISYRKSRKGKFRLKNIPRNIARLRLYQKNLESFIKSVTSSPIGIKRVREETEDKIKKTLSNITDVKITNKDLDDFYNLNTDKDIKSLTEKIPPSNLYVLIQEAKTGKLSQNDFVDQVKIFMNSNDENVRITATNLYNKYVG